MRPMRLSPSVTPLSGALLLACLLAGCTTIQNRRDLYFPQTVQGPYTRMVNHGLSIPSPTPLNIKGSATSTGTGSGKEVIKPRG